MVTINTDDHPGLHRYSLELAKYPELSEEQYASVLSDLKQPEGSVLYQNARETLICSHLAMILGMAKDTYCALPYLLHRSWMPSLPGKPHGHYRSPNSTPPCPIRGKSKWNFSVWCKTKN